MKLILVILMMLNLKVHAGDCVRNFKPFLGPKQPLVERLDYFIEKVSTISDFDLEKSLSEWIRVTNAYEGYLPGLTPKWNPKNLEDLYMDLYTNGYHAMMRNIIGNLDKEGAIRLFADKPNVDKSFLEEMFAQTRIALLLKEYSHRHVGELK